jgi:hypothetical protein
VVETNRWAAGTVTLIVRCGARCPILRRSGIKSMYAFDRHDVGYPGIPKTGVLPIRPKTVGLPGFTAIP